MIRQHPGPMLAQTKARVARITDDSPPRRDSPLSTHVVTVQKPGRESIVRQERDSYSIPYLSVDRMSLPLRQICSAFISFRRRASGGDARPSLLSSDAASRQGFGPSSSTTSQAKSGTLVRLLGYRAPGIQPAPAAPIGELAHQSTDIDDVRAAQRHLLASVVHQLCATGLGAADGDGEHIHSWPLTRGWSSAAPSPTTKAKSDHSATNHGSPTRSNNRPLISRPLFVILESVRSICLASCDRRQSLASQSCGRGSPSE